MSNPTSKNNYKMCCVKCNNHNFALHEKTPTVIRSKCMNCGFLYELRRIENYVNVLTYISDPEASRVPVRKPVFIKRMIPTRVVTSVWVPVGTVENTSTLV
jgi:hypothetical protein